MGYPNRNSEYVKKGRFNIEQLPSDTMGLSELMEDVINGWGYADVLESVADAATASYYNDVKKYVAARLFELAQEVRQKFPEDEALSLVDAHWENFADAFGGDDPTRTHPTLEDLRLGKFD